MCGVGGGGGGFESVREGDVEVLDFVVCAPGAAAVDCGVLVNGLWSCIRSFFMLVEGVRGNGFG